MGSETNDNSGKGQTGLFRSVARGVLLTIMFPIRVLLQLAGLVVAMIFTIPLLPFWGLEVDVFGPRQLRRTLGPKGRLLGEAECLARLGRGEGTLLVEKLVNNARAWWTPDTVPAVPEVNSGLDSDTTTAEGYRANFNLERVIDRYLSLNGGTALLVRAHGGKRFARKCPADRVVVLDAFLSSFGLLTGPSCARCKFDLTGLTPEVCPECGAEVPEHDRTFLAVRAEEAAAGILPPVQQPRRR